MGSTVNEDLILNQEMLDFDTPIIVTSESCCVMAISETNWHQFLSKISVGEAAVLR